MSEALGVTRATVEPAVESLTVDGRMQPGRLGTTRAQAESYEDREAVEVKAAANASPRTSHCSFCRAELDGNLGLTIAGSGRYGARGRWGLFCSTRCRDCVLALAALHPSPLASNEFIAQRTHLTDRLLDLWRRGQGPDPALVLEAAKRASRGSPTTTVVPKVAPADPPLANSGAIPRAKPPATTPEAVEPANPAVWFPPAPTGTH